MRSYGQGDDQGQHCAGGAAADERGLLGERCSSGPITGFDSFSRYFILLSIILWSVFLSMSYLIFLITGFSTWPWYLSIINFFYTTICLSFMLISLITGRYTQ